jgi:hypothetical protein
MEPRFGHDFSGVRVHTDGRAGTSANAVGAVAYTVGNDIVFAPGRHRPESVEGRSLLAHELTHVVQQRGAVPPTPRSTLVERPDGGSTIEIAPEVDNVGAEGQATATEAAAAAWTFAPAEPLHASSSQGEPAALALQQVRIPLPTGVPLCGRTVTHIDVEPPRWRDLEPCTPRGLPVYRHNIVGRDLTVPTPGRGPQVFNLHVGVYRDPATGRWCGIVHDSRRCLPAWCLKLCAPTLQEVLDWIIGILKALLVVIGVIALAILIAIIIELLGPILVPAFASAGDGDQSAPGSGQSAPTAVAQSDTGPTPASSGGEGGGEAEGETA